MDTPPANGFTAAVVGLKTGDQAKTRLKTLPDALRRELAWTMALDTIRSLAAAVDFVFVVGRPSDLQDAFARTGLPVQIVAEPPTGGLNAALAAGAASAQQDGATMVLASVADLPALLATSVRKVLTASAASSRSFVADASGWGTTMLIARDVGLRPHFQGASAAAHASSGALPLGPPLLAAVPDARTDVDTEVDLGAACRLGLGPATAELVERTARLRLLRSA
jgi:2-phospho-L-lactate/phosphoenolpyruvate guanylyltransferase